MHFYYKQATGELFHARTAQSHDLLCIGHSGFGIGRNDPVFQNMERVGPIPRGVYDILPAKHRTTLGDCVLWLSPWPSTETFGRTGIAICGIDKPECNEGHIVAPRAVREAIDAERRRAYGCCKLVVL